MYLVYGKLEIGDLETSSISATTMGGVLLRTWRWGAGGRNLDVLRSIFAYCRRGQGGEDGDLPHRDVPAFASVKLPTQVENVEIGYLGGFSHVPNMFGMGSSPVMVLGVGGGGAS